jgi:HSP20 family protein
VGQVCPYVRTQLQAAASAAIGDFLEGTRLMRPVTLASQEDLFSSMNRQMGRWVDHVLGAGRRQYSPDKSWIPAVNLYEDRERYCMVVDLAGVRPEEAELKIEKDVLVLTGERAAPAIPDPAGAVRLHVMEIDHGPFCRTLKLPPGIDREAIFATYREGYLWVCLPKKRQGDADGRS